MNYGCGSTVHARDLEIARAPYVGAGGMNTTVRPTLRHKGGVVGVDVVPEMLEASSKNFKVVEVKKTPGLVLEFVELHKVKRCTHPWKIISIDVAAQNCLFNIFKAEDLKKAIIEGNVSRAKTRW
jgi:hypothetical protein